ncbi:12090_t:CDS:2, partial [Gigaspora rosea]
LTTTENVKCLHGYVGARYSNIFDLEHRQYKAKKEINSVIKLAKRDASSLESKIEQGIQTDLMLNLQKSDINSALIQTLELLEKESDNSSSDEYSDIESDQDETSNIQEIINLLITKGKLGSSLFVSTEIFLELILKQPCPKCYNIEIVTKKHQIIVSGFSVKINITCTKCSTTVFYKNEADGIDYSKLIASAGLVGGVNREEWVTMLCACESAENSANFALRAACEQVKSQAKNEKWKYLEQPIMNFYSRAIYAACIRAGNNSYSLPTDNDLHKLHYDIVMDHLLDNYNLTLPEPNLIGKFNIQSNALKEFLKGITQLAPHQSLITNMRTSQNESVNKIKLNYTDKKQDYPKSYKTCHALAVIHNNNGILELLQILRQAGKISKHSNQDLLNIALIWKQREDKRICNIAEIHKKNETRAKKIIQQKDQLQDFDWPQVIQDNITKYTFQPSFSVLIPNFDSFILCEGCSSFPKRFPEQGLCKLCGFYWNNELSHFITNSKFHSIKSKSLTQPKSNIIKIALLEIFNLQNFKELQLESIESFISHKDTLTIIPTGGDKTLIFSIASILFYGLTVVFTLLKSVMECQLRELINIGIPSAYLFAATDQLVDIQKKFFSEIASGLIKVLWIAPEKFIQNFQFRQMLKKLAEIRSIQFVVDEAHYIKEYAHFRLAWNQLSQLKDEFTSAPILLLTATYSEYIANQLAINLKCSHINIICNIQIYRPELNLQVLSKPAKKD